MASVEHINHHHRQQDQTMPETETPAVKPQLFFDKDTFNELDNGERRALIDHAVVNHFDDMTHYYLQENIDYSDISAEELLPHQLQAVRFRTMYMAVVFDVASFDIEAVWVNQIILDEIDKFNFSVLDSYDPQELYEDTDSDESY